MSEQVIDFDPPGDGEQGEAEAQADVTEAVTRIAALNSRAVMPDGRTLNRPEILASMGLNPNTPPTAWLNIIGCGSNASALLPGDLQRIAVARLSNASAVLKRAQTLSAEGAAGAGAQGFMSGGRANT